MSAQRPNRQNDPRNPDPRFLVDMACLLVSMGLSIGRSERIDTQNGRPCSDAGLHNFHPALGTGENGIGHDDEFGFRQLLARIVDEYMVRNEIGVDLLDSSLLRKSRDELGTNRQTRFAQQHQRHPIIA